MKFAALLSLASLALGSVLLEKRDCHEDNCVRAVQGTRDGLPATSLRSADCSSFLSTVVTPLATTITVTVTADVGSTTLAAVRRRDAALQIRQVTAVPTLIPDYADNCANAAEYINACTCWGITPVVTTLPASTITEYTTVTGLPDDCDEDDL